MEQTQLKKKVAMLKQEKKKLLEGWALLQQHLRDMKLLCKDQEEETTGLQTQQQQVGAGSWARTRSSTICSCNPNLSVLPPICA